MPGDTCDSNADCATISNSECIEGSCTGKSLNTTCINDQGCSAGLYCKDSSCKETKRAGESCTGDVERGFL